MLVQCAAVKDPTILIEKRWRLQLLFVKINWFDGKKENAMEHLDQN